MQSTPNLRDTDPHDVFVMEPDVSLAARADKAPLDLLYDVLSHPSAPQRPDPELRIAPDFSAVGPAPSADAAARGTVADDIPVNDIGLNDISLNDIRPGDTEIGAHPPATSKFARGAVMSLFALGSAMAAAAWQHYGDDAKAMMAHYSPPFSLASLVSTEKPATSEPPAAVQTSVATQTAAQPAPSADTAAPATANAALATANAAPATAASPDQSQVIQSMARDLASMGQQIGELKASIEQLKASQPQLASAPARTTEAKLAEPKAAEPVLTRPRIVPPPPHAALTPVRKPKQVFPYAPIAPTSPPPAAAAPVQIAPQVQAAEDGGPVVRPPMPLH
jgi:hypothetical protein